VTGSRDGTIQVWDIRQESTPVLKIEPKEGEVKRDCWTVSFGNFSFSKTQFNFNFNFFFFFFFIFKSITFTL